MHTLAKIFELDDIGTSSKSFSKMDYALRREKARRFHRALCPQPVSVLADAGSCIMRYGQEGWH